VRPSDPIVRRLGPVWWAVALLIGVSVGWYAAPRVLPWWGIQVVSRSMPPEGWSVHQFRAVDVPFEILNRTWYHATVEAVQLPCGVTSAHLFSSTGDELDTPTPLPAGGRLMGKVHIQTYGRIGTAKFPIRLRVHVLGFILERTLVVPLRVERSLFVDPLRLEFDFRRSQRPKTGRIVVVSRDDALAPTGAMTTDPFLSLEVRRRSMSGAEPSALSVEVIVRCDYPGPEWGGVVSGSVLLKFRHPHISSLRVPIACRVPEPMFDYEPRELWLAPGELNRVTRRQVWLRLRRGSSVRVTDVPTWAEVTVQQLSAEENVATVRLRVPSDLAPSPGKLTFEVRHTRGSARVDVPVYVMLGGNSGQSLPR